MITQKQVKELFTNLQTSNNAKFFDSVAEDVR